MSHQPSTSSSSSVLATWPPKSITDQTQEIIDECELMEMIPHRANGKQFVGVVELAALLYQGEYAHARHCHRRWKDLNATELTMDWWKVGAAMMQHDGPAIWQALSHIQTHHPAPFNRYAMEVSTAYRIRILRMCGAAGGGGGGGAGSEGVQHAQQQPLYWQLLNFASQGECEAFCQAHQSDLMAGKKNGSTTKTSHPSSSINSLGGGSSVSLTQMVTFFESPSKKGRI